MMYSEIPPEEHNCLEKTVSF